MTVLAMIQSVRCANNKRTSEVISWSICAVVQRNRIRLGTPVWVLAPICLDSSDRLLKLERTSIPRNELRKLQWNPPSHDSSGRDRRVGGTVLSSPRGQRRYLEIRQRWTAGKPRNSIRSCARHFQTEAAIDLACEQDRVLREHFPQTARSHREEKIPPDLEEIYEPRHLDQEEDEDDETETARPLSEREKRELFRQHRDLGHSQPTDLARALRHAGARREAIRVRSQRVALPIVRSTTSTAATPSRNVTTLFTFEPVYWS